MQGGAHYINARRNRADLITANAAGRYVGDGVDDVTHLFPPLRFAQRIWRTGAENECV